MSEKYINHAWRDAAMGAGIEVVVGVGARSALAAFAFYRWQTRRRVRRVEESVTDYLVARHGAPLSVSHGISSAAERITDYPWLSRKPSSRGKRNCNPSSRPRRGRRNSRPWRLGTERPGAR